MNSKKIFTVLALFGLVFSQETHFWSSVTHFGAGDTVFFRNARYIAVEDSVIGGEHIFEDRIINSTPGEDHGLFWRRAVPLVTPAVQSGRQPRLLPGAHRDAKRLLIEYDGFVRGVAEIAGFDLNDIGSVGLFREKQVVGSMLHSSWGDFMVNGGRWDPIADTLTRFPNHQFNTDPDALREAIRSIVERRYNRYPRKGKFEQIIHNIGDAGVAFNHSLSSYLPCSGRRERGVEIAARNILDDTDNWQDISSTYFVGSIYNAIAEYGIRTLSALRWAKGNTNTDGYCGIPWKIIFIIPLPAPEPFTFNYECYKKHRNEFELLVRDQNLGVMRFALAVGRHILIDAILAERPLEHQRIIGEPFLRPNATHNFTAYARDPDAVIFIRSGDNSRLTPNSKRLVYNVRDGSDTVRYELWHEPSAHDMYFEWSINGNRIFPNSATENAYNAFTAIRDSLTELNRLISVKKDLLFFMPCCCDASPQQLQEKEVLREEILMLEAEHRSLQPRYNSLRAAYLSFIKSSDLEVNTAFSNELAETLRAGIDSTVSIRFFGSRNYNVRLTNSSFNLTAGIIDDEGDFVTVTRELTFRNTIPVAQASIRQGNSPMPYLAVTQRKNTSSLADDYHFQKNNLRVMSGFSSPAAYENIYIDFF